MNYGDYKGSKFAQNGIKGVKPLGDGVGECFAIFFLLA